MELSRFDSYRALLVLRIDMDSNFFEDEENSAPCDNNKLLSFGCESFIKPNWIKCSEKIPEERVSVLVYNSYDDIIRIDFIVTLDTPRGYAWCNILLNEDKQDRITRWMSLPDKPKD